MAHNIPNKPDDISIVQEVVDKARDNAFSETNLDLRLCRKRSKNAEFMRANGFTNHDVRQALSNLRVAEYCTTSFEEGKPDAYVFQPCLDGIDVYLKIHVEDGVVVVSFHDPDRALSFPYREGK